MSNKKKLLLITTYLLFLFILFEGLARLAYINPSTSKRLWVNDNLSWHRTWVQRHQSTGKEIYFTFDMYDSLKGWISKPNLRDMPVFENKFLNTNSKGLRGTPEYSYTKSNDKIRILILGDSYTFGEEVSDNETYPHYLQEMLPDCEVMNFGIHGYGHDQMLLYLQEEGLKYNPDIIILGFIQPDMSRNMVSFRDYAKPKYSLKDNELILTATPVPTPEKTLKWDWIRPRTFDITSNIRFNLKNRLGIYKEEENKLAEAILLEIAQKAESIQAIPLYVYIPIIPEIFNTDSLTEGEMYLSEICKSDDKLKYLSARPHLMEQLNAGTTYKERGHWGPIGNYTIAEAIKLYLAENDFFNNRDSY